MTRTRSAAFLSRVALAAGLALPGGAAFCDADVVVVNGVRVRGSLDPVDESEHVRATLVPGSRLTAKCKGVDTFLPRLMLTRPVGGVVIGETRRSTAVLSATAIDGGEHVLRVEPADGQPGTYELRVRWTTPRRLRGPGESAAGDREFRFFAEAGTRVRVAALPGKSGATAALVRLTGPAGFEPVELSGRRSPPIDLDVAGAYRVVADDGPEDAEMRFEVRVTPPRPVSVRFDVTNAAVFGGADPDAAVPVAVAQTVTRAGGSVEISLPTDPEDVGFDAIGSGVQIPAGALPTAQPIVVGATTPIRVPGATPIGATVFFGPEGLTFGTRQAPSNVLITIPADLSFVQGDPRRVRIVVRDGAGVVSDVPISAADRDAGFPDFTSRPDFVTFPAAHFSSYAAVATHPVEATFAASDPSTDRFFGSAVATDGDTAIVGGYNGSLLGGAYVFTRSGSRWTFQQKLLGSTAVPDDHFGSAVAVDGDRAFVAARQKGAYEGRVYVFERSGGVWSETQILVGSATGANSYFGESIALSGDTLVVGSTEFNQPGEGYVFRRSGGVWTEEALLSASDAASNDAFGASVAIDGDTMVVGARQNDAGRGAAYVFTRSGVVWTEQAKLTLPSAAAGERAQYVALHGGTLLLGAPDAGSGAGRVAVFVGSGATWTLQQELVSADAVGLGRTVAVRGDRVLVGARSATDGSDIARLFERSGAVWNLGQRFEFTTAAPGSGARVALADGRAIIGASEASDLESAFLVRFSE